jgi:hypothetical protein
LTPNGSPVAARTAAISAAIAAGVLYPAARKPSAPARVAAITRSVVDGPPAMGATAIGRRSRSVNRYRAISSTAALETVSLTASLLAAGQQLPSHEPLAVRPVMLVEHGEAEREQ